MRAASITCFVIAVVVSAWFVLGARQAIDTSRARAIADQGNHLTLAQEQRVGSLVHGARLLNPDKEPDILLGQAEVEHRDFVRARQVLRPVTRSEPQNIEGWAWLAHSAAHDPALLYIAALQVRQLEPRSPGK